MRRALQLAALADHATSPNPMVGTVLLDLEGRLAGEGHHARAGEPHAEVLALTQAGPRAKGGTLYVTLEPCAHHGRTPPCVDAILAAGVRRVVIAMEDPDSRISGRGIARLREAGVELEVGVEEAAARKLNRFYVKHRTTGLPFVTAKFAISLDGRIATAAGESRWITGEAARAEAHQLRRRHDAILVGAGTVVEDDPKLTNRLPGGGRQPLRVVVDSTLRIPATATVLTGQAEAPTLVATTARAAAAAVAAFESGGVEVLRLPASGPQKRVDLAALLEELGRRDVLSLLVEGGAEVHGAFFDAGLVDAVVVLLAPIVIGGEKARAAVGGAGVERLADAFRLDDLEVTRIGEDLMLSGDVHRDR
jgi:diaminohydroxyphosphoribosylaminopyrimidine deaminase/5-amino-6-(5-phosphoribosylamino)uracil reductase